jgi:hypothetical protein
MATATYVPLATQTLGSNASSITFSSIPSGYTDLKIRIVATSSTAPANITYQFNGDTGTNYSNTYVYGNGSSALASSIASNSYLQTDYGSHLSLTNPQTVLIDIFSYTGSSYKTTLATLSADYNGSGNVVSLVGLWRSTATITSIVLTAPFATGTTATLWGI